MESFGVIVSLKMMDFDLDRQKIIDAFHKADLDEAFIPNERMPRKAFQKALSESVQGEEGFMIRPVLKKGDTMSSGLVKEQKDQESKDLKYDVCNIVTLNSNLEIIQGKSDFRTDAIVDAYKTYRNKLGAAEVLFKIKELFFVSMGINILCDKCVFIPHKYKENVLKLVSLFDELADAGAIVNIEVIGVDNGTETRNTIVGQFRDQTLDLLDKELKFCLKQREKFEQGKIKYLRPTAFRKQLMKLKMLEERIKTYIVLLSLTPEEDKVITDKLQLVDAEISKNIEIASANAKRRTSKQIIKDYTKSDQNV